mmetsp:Transcript_34389/g.51290  ORF Transcript_34389/g.51290 Transcript_34389/m.51290 type:complete len:150 (-) Transcript_34389:98-547(-)
MTSTATSRQLKSKSPLRSRLACDELQAARVAMQQTFLGQGPRMEDPRVNGDARVSHQARSSYLGEAADDMVPSQQRWRYAPVPAGSFVEQEERKQAQREVLSRCLHASVRLANERGRAASAFAALKRARAKLAVTESWLASATASEICG